MSFGGDDEEINLVIGGEVKIDTFKIEIASNGKFICIVLQQHFLQHSIL